MHNEQVPPLASHIKLGIVAIPCPLGLAQNSSAFREKCLLCA